jgi:GT2 family glycosyltransferase
VADETPSTPRVAVVILNWNGRPFLERFLPSVQASTWPNLEVVLADNCSTDNSVAWVLENHPGITIIENPRNEGFAAGYNTALQQVVADYYVLLNQDVEVEPGWIEPVVAMLQADPQAGAAMPRLLDESDRTRFEYAGAAGGQLDRYGYPFCRGRLFDHMELDEGQYASGEVFWASGAAMFIRAELYHNIGGLDPDFFAHMEEIDLCWRLRRAGWKVLCSTEAAVYHVGGGSLSRSNPRKTYLNFRNNLRLILKNFPATKLLWLLPFRVLLDLLAAANELRQGKFADTRAILRAGFGFLFSLPYWLGRRRHYNHLVENVRVGKNRTTAPGYYRGSIVWNFFARGLKRYSDLPGRNDDVSG